MDLDIGRTMKWLYLFIAKWDERDWRVHIANFTIAVTIGHKVRTRIVAINIWRADLDTGWLLESRRMTMGHCVRRKILQTYGDVVNTQNTKQFYARVFIEWLTMSHSRCFDNRHCFGQRNSEGVTSRKYRNLDYKRRVSPGYVRKMKRHLIKVGSGSRHPL